VSLVLDRNVAGPAAHALVIGVGHYRYLSGGAEETPQAILSIGILRQLTSPPRSAVAFANWLEATKDQWKVPIATIDLLVSPAQEDADAGVSGAAFQAATIDNIESAYTDWKARCNTDDASAAIFFFSGHGVEKGEHFLLAEDFGKNPLNPWKGAFDFDSTRRAFHSTRSATQCFFVDACRKVTSKMLQQDVKVGPLEIVDFTDTAECEFDLTMKAAASNEAAHGKPKEPSYFTQALQVALGGGVAERENGKWLVESGQVVKRIYDVLGMIKADQSFKQRCKTEITASTTLLETPPPNVHLRVHCTPALANAVAQFSCKKEPNGQPRTHAGTGAPWELDVEAGVYSVKAEFPGNDFTDAGDLAEYNPPKRNIELDCT
jgi:hypothetical protein